jgi:toxin ParE1/3/4
VTLQYIFHPLAAAELDQAVAYYEGIQRGKGLELAVRVHAVMEQIREHPDSASATFGSVRSVPVQPTSRWSYTLHYRATPTCIRVLALAHQRRQPFYWFGRR